MASGASTTTADHITKRIYLKGDLPSELVKRRHPLLGMMKRESCYFGEGARYSMKYSNPQSISGPYATAATNSETSAASPQGYQFEMTEAEKHGRITVGSKSILKTKTNEAAFVRLWRHATEGMIEEFSNRLAWNMFRDGTGLRGQRASESSDVTTLASGYYARDFEIDALLVAASDSAGSSLRDSGASTPVVSVNLADNTVGLDTSAISGYTDNDYLFYEGEIASAYNPDGLATHFPLTAPSSGESFRGTGNDRSVYPERLAGSRINNTSAAPESNLGLLTVRIHDGGGKANVGFASSETVWEIAERRGAQVQYQSFGGAVKYGYEYVVLSTPGGTIRLYSDADCPQNRSYVNRLEDLCIAHADKLIHVIMDDGKITTRQPSDSGLEQRWRTVCQTKVLRPRDHGVNAVS